MKDPLRISTAQLENACGSESANLLTIRRLASLTILAGLFEKETDPPSGAEKIYNTYLCVSGDGLLANRRKLHPFIARHLSAGACIHCV